MSKGLLHSSRAKEGKGPGRKSQSFSKRTLAEVESAPEAVETLKKLRVSSDIFA